MGKKKPAIAGFITCLFIVNLIISSSIFTGHVITMQDQGLGGGINGTIEYKYEFWYYYLGNLTYTYDNTTYNQLNYARLTWQVHNSSHLMLNFSVYRHLLTPQNWSMTGAINYYNYSADITVGGIRFHANQTNVDGWGSIFFGFVSHQYMQVHFFTVEVTWSNLHNSDTGDRISNGTKVVSSYMYVNDQLYTLIAIATLMLPIAIIGTIISALSFIFLYRRRNKR